MFKDNYHGFVIKLFFIFPLISYCVLTLFWKAPELIFLSELICFWIFFFIVLPTLRKFDNGSFSLGHLWVIIVGIQLVLIPILMTFFGISMFRLHREVSDNNFRSAVLLQSFSYLVFGLGFISRRARANLPSTVNIENTVSLLRVLFLGGSVGVFCLLYLKVTGDDSISGIFSSNSNFILKFMAITFSPWLFFAYVYWYFCKIKTVKNLKNFFFFSSFLGVLSLSPLLLLNLNRAVLFVPTVIFLLIRFPPTFSFRSLTAWGLMIIFAGIIFAQIGDYRARVNVSQKNRYSLESAGYTPNPSVAQTLQLYTNSPQYLGYGLQYIDREKISWRTPIISLLLPLPKMSFLANLRLDGSTLFNYSVYERINVRDLYFSSAGEIFLSYGLFGFFVFFFASGIILKYFHDEFIRSQQQFKKYVYLLAGFWLMLLPIFSISVISQIFFYQIAPVLFILRLTKNRVVH